VRSLEEIERELAGLCARRALPPGLRITVRCSAAEAPGRPREVERGPEESVVVAHPEDCAELLRVLLARVR
jgi:hypothetical protein